MAVWQRPLPSDLADALPALDLDGLDDVTLTLDLPVTVDGLAANLVIAGYDAPSARLLAADAAQLAHHLAQISGCARMKLRLEIIETDACRRFHADYVTYRMLTTYRGPATQWIRAKHPDDIAQLQTGDVAVLKGRLLTEEPAVLHRSPPIAGTGTQRLLLVLDPVME